MDKENLVLGLEILTVIAKLPLGEWIKLVKETVEKTYGMIYKSTPAEIHGTKGFLIWDYMVCNEITFKDKDENIVSLYKNFSDKETEEKWNELVKKFGV